jgi:hypothetical protein
MSHEYSFFLAGTMQGSRAGAEELDQTYRVRLKDLIQTYYPGSTVYCPKELMRHWLWRDATLIQQSHAGLAHERVILREAYDPPLLRLTHTFAALARLAGQVNVVVAYVPDHEASMGTAVEMWSAWQNNKTVVAITPMKQNLAVLSCASVIVPTVDDFEQLLAEGWLERHGLVPTTPAADFLRGDF